MTIDDSFKQDRSLRFGFLLFQNNVAIPFLALCVDELSPIIEKKNTIGGLRAFQNGFARIRSDADASTHKKSARRHADASDKANADR